MIILTTLKLHYAYGLAFIMKFWETVKLTLVYNMLLWFSFIHTQYITFLNSRCG